jgi:hypothetical protein
LQDSISKYNSNRGFTVAAFLDFEKAYDMLWRPGLLTKVKRLGIHGNMFSFIENFISERTFQVKVGAELSEAKILENGTPQGSIISPILFLIMINDMAEICPEVEHSLFADDSAVYKSGRNLSVLINDIQRALDLLTDWCDDWGLQISLKKSTIVIFTHRIKYKVKPILYKGVSIKIEDKAKFLGMIFDKRLTWQSHIRYIADRCSARLNLMRSLAGTRWGASKTALLTVYRALIRSLLDYGAEALDSASQGALAKFDALQYRALKICCGAMHGTALEALQGECGELPLALRRRRQQLRYCIKVLSTPDHPASSILKDHWTNHYGRHTPNIYAKVKDFFEIYGWKIPTVNLKPDADPPWSREPFSVDCSLSLYSTQKK